METFFFFTALIFIVLLILPIVLAVKLATLTRRVDALEKRFGIFADAIGVTQSEKPDHRIFPRPVLAVDNTRKAGGRYSRFESR